MGQGADEGEHLRVVSVITRDHALDVLVLLSELAQRARSAGTRLYCWWAL
ncbi:hypothetical protein [Actinoallomurus sp. CA-150999]